MKLSYRLQTVASFADRGCSVADIGTDHGYIPIWLTEEGIADHAIAMDVGKGPLERATEHIRKHGLEEKIETRLSDGVAKLEPGEADTVIVAGMGGELVMKILDEGRHVWDSVKNWILSPQSEIGRVRHYLADQGFVIVGETMVMDEGKYYTVMKVQRGVMDYEKEAYYQYGKLPAEQKNPVLRQFLEKEKKQTVQILAQVKTQDTEASLVRRGELEQELGWIEEIEHEMQ